MPELPEVETIRSSLQKHIVGHVIQDVEIRLPKQISGEVQRLKGAKIQRVKRYGKGLVIELDNGYSITVHVKMTGQMLYRGGPNYASTSRGKRVSQVKVDLRTLPDKYTHVIFYLDQGAVLFYRDVRQFGWIKIVRSDSVASQQYFKSLGPEPAVASSSAKATADKEAVAGKDFLTRQYFRDILSKRKTPIKMLLMDQGLIAGIGNIYANDALYISHIHPHRPANSLDESELEKLFEAIEVVLRKGIEVGGASEWSYVDALGRAGKYQDFFQVYRKHGKPCPRCGTTIETMRMGGRGTFFCPRCQK